jgi:hypothetical protein
LTVVENKTFVLGRKDEERNDLEKRTGFSTRFQDQKCLYNMISIENSSF